MARTGCRWLSERALEHFYTVFVSVSIDIRWDRFYTKSLFWDMSETHTRNSHGLWKISHQIVKDLMKWRSMSHKYLEGRKILPRHNIASIHSEKAGFGYCGTMNMTDMLAAVQEKSGNQRLSKWQERNKIITNRKLKEVKMVLMSILGQYTVTAARKMFCYMSKTRRLYTIPTTSCPQLAELWKRIFH